MIEDELIHWEEGLFIQPQHFQVLQRQVHRRVTAERRLGLPFPYGVVRCEIDRAAMSVQGGGRLQFTQLQVVMKNGLVIKCGPPGDPDVNAELAPLDLNPLMGLGDKIRVHLAVQSDRANDPIIARAATNGSAKDGPAGSVTGLYRVRTHDKVPDENTGSDEAAVSTRVINARLIPLATGDTAPSPASVESIPLLQLIASDPVRLDADFAPPTLLLGGWRPLQQQFDLVKQIVEAARNEMSSGVAPRTDPPSRSDTERSWRLRTLNLYAARLSHAVKNQSLTPFAAYGLCLDLLAELRAYRHGSEAVQSDFNHDAPWLPFRALVDELRDEMRITGPEPIIYPFQPIVGNGSIYFAEPRLELLNQGYRCIIGVGSENAAELNTAIRNRNIIVGCVSMLQVSKREGELPWHEDASFAHHQPLASEQGETRYLAVPFDPKNQPLYQAWYRVYQEQSRLAVTYARHGATSTMAGQSQRNFQFRLYLVPPPAAIGSPAT